MGRGDGDCLPRAGHHAGSDGGGEVLHPELAREPQFVERFLEMELRIARLFHPHIVTVFDAGTQEDECFVVMEYVAGGVFAMP